MTMKFSFKKLTRLINPDIYLSFTLQPSHVIAPKWNPDDLAPQTRHGISDISVTGNTAAPID